MHSRSPFANHRWAMLFSLSGFVALLDPLRRNAGTPELVLTLAGIAAFVALFASLLSAWRRHATGMWQTLAIGALGAIFYPFNSLAWVFLAMAAAFAACVAAGDLRATAGMVGAILTVVLIEKIALGLTWPSFLQVAGISVPTAIMCMLTLRRGEEMRELARLQERDRMARDMHDVLGHTLSLVILKAELASRVARADPDRAIAELDDVDRIARTTLDEVRDTLQGYRTRSLGRELELARNTLQIAGLTVNVEGPVPKLGASQESALCLALREGVTNVIRHSGARNCHVTVARDHDRCTLTLEDDGAGSSMDSMGRKAVGMGLQGMRERLEACGGSLTVDSRGGTKLLLVVPLAASAPR